MQLPFETIKSAKSILEACEVLETPRIAYRLDCFVDASQTEIHMLDYLARNGDIGFVLIAGVPYITFSEAASNMVIDHCREILKSHIGH